MFGTYRDLDFVFVSAVPPWTHRSNQYSSPIWDPLGSGSLQPGISTAIAITLRPFTQIAAGQRNSRQFVCVGGSAASAGTTIQAVPVDGDPCVEIRVLQALPRTNTPRPPAPQSFTPTPQLPIETPPRPVLPTPSPSLTPTVTETAAPTVTATWFPETSKRGGGDGPNAPLIAGLSLGSALVVGAGAGAGVAMLLLPSAVCSATGTLPHNVYAV